MDREKLTILNLIKGMMGYTMMTLIMYLMIFYDFVKTAERIKGGMKLKIRKNKKGYNRKKDSYLINKQK